MDTNRHYPLIIFWTKYLENVFSFEKNKFDEKQSFFKILKDLVVCGNLQPKVKNKGKNSSIRYMPRIFLKEASFSLSIESTGSGSGVFLFAAENGESESGVGIRNRVTEIPRFRSRKFGTWTGTGE